MEIQQQITQKILKKKVLKLQIPKLLTDRPDALAI